MRDEQLGEEVMDIMKDAIDSANAPPPAPVQGGGGAAVKQSGRPTRPQIR
jgi:hypothetical protein